MRMFGFNTTEPADLENLYAAVVHSTLGFSSNVAASPTVNPSNTIKNSSFRDPRFLFTVPGDGTTPDLVCDEFWPLFACLHSIPPLFGIDSKVAVIVEDRISRG